MDISTLISSSRHIQLSAEESKIPWEEAVSGLANFLDSWQKVGPEEAQKRAKRYLTAMPAWAHKADE